GRDVAQGRAARTGRRGFEETELPERVRLGIRRVFGADLTADEVVDRILRDVREEGDAAVRRYTREIDGAEPAALEVPREEWDLAIQAMDAQLVAALETAAEQIAAFHRKQLRTSWIDYTPEGALGQIVRPLERIGVYAPGGTAVYPSSLLMTAVPARVAGVSEIVVCSPPTGGRVSPLILAAAKVAGVDRGFQIGGAQAVGAMADGAATIPPVDKIFGPGNIFVVLAKQRVYGTVAIDQLPGPTETLVVADDSADPAITAADLLAQAEHDVMASAILITTSPELAHSVERELQSQLAALERRDIART